MKLVIIGLDGGTLTLIEKYRSSLPTFNRIMQEGAYGVMTSTIPVLTCPAWPVISTGLNPAQLGMFDYIRLWGNFAPHRYTDYFQKTIWQKLNDKNYSVGLINVPMTYPPVPMNGYMVSGLDTPRGTKRYYSDNISQYMKGYEILPPVVLTVSGKEKEYRDALLNSMARLNEFIFKLIAQRHTDVVFAVHFALDAIQHYFWKCMDEEHPWHTTNTYSNVIMKAYQSIDYCLFRIINDYPHATLMVVSDHGFGACYGGFSPNALFQRKGLLKFKTDPYETKSNGRDTLIQKMPVWAVKLGEKLLPSKIKEKLTTVGEEVNGISRLFNSVDWLNTKALALGITGGIYCDKDVRCDVIYELSKFGYFTCYEKEKIYHGEYLDKAPDISIVAKEYYPTATGHRWERQMWHTDNSTEGSGAHLPEGIFMAYGKGIRAGRLEGLSIYNFAPTVLKIFGVESNLQQPINIFKE